MAFVTITWEYGDTSTIEGFRVYRGTSLRGQIEDVTARQYFDNVDDTTELRATYTVVAYDKYGRESTRCATADVELTYLMIPKMTSANEPSGLVTSNFSGSINGLYSGSEPYNFFDREMDLYTTVLDLNGGANNDLGDWRLDISYTFSSLIIADRWGFQQFLNNDAVTDTEKLKITAIAIDTTTSNEIVIGMYDFIAKGWIADGDEYIEDVDKIQADKFTFRLEGAMNNKNSIPRYFSNFLIFGRPS